MTNLEMFYFVGRCLSIDEHPEFRDVMVQKISEDEIEWTQFVSLCSNHLILPVIYLKFKAHKLIEYLPEELAEFLKEIYDLNLARNEQILLQIKDILKLLNANDIYPTFLKGTGNLLDGLYSDKGERIIGDIDFLVPEEDYLEAARILEEDGYVKNSTFSSDLLNPKHYPSLFKVGVPAVVEVHRLIVSKRFGKMFNSETIDIKMIKKTDDITISFVLSDFHNIILNFIHSQLAHGGNRNGIVSFRDIYDLYLISKRTDIASTIKMIQEKKRAISYFIFAGRALNLPEHFYPSVTFYSKLLNIKHSLNYTSAVFYHAHRITMYLYNKIFRVYLKVLFQSTYSKKMRKALVECLSRKQWYIDQYNYYSDFLRPNR
jgi:hypothetical protein